MGTILATLFCLWLLGSIVGFVGHVAWWTLRIAFKVLIWVLGVGLVLSLIAIPAVAVIAIAVVIGLFVARDSSH